MEATFESALKLVKDTVPAMNLEYWFFYLQLQKDFKLFSFVFPDVVYPDSVGRYSNKYLPKYKIIFLLHQLFPIVLYS